MDRKIALLFVLVLSATGIVAQIGNPTTETGLKPYGTYHGGDIDTVSVFNGKIDLHVPLVSYPQRGSLQFGFTLRYDNPRPEVDKTCDIPNKPCDYTTYFSGGGVQVIPDFAYQIYQQAVVIGGNFIGYLYSVVSPDGSSHQLGWLGGTLYESVDATGFRFDSNTNVITDSNGIRYFTTGSLMYSPGGSLPNPTNVGRVEDPNGNLITYSNGVYVDSVGRHIPAPSGTSTPDFSHCTGTLQTNSAVTWQIPGPQGSTLTYKFCYALVNINFILTVNGPHYFPAGGSQGMLQSIVLPNLTTWTFLYDNNASGALVMATLPTGGTVSWGQSTTRICSPSDAYPQFYAYSAVSRVVSDGIGQPQTWTYNRPLPNYNPVTVTDPLQNQSVTTYLSLNGSCSMYEGTTQYYQGSVSPSNLLKTVSTDYAYTANPDFGGGWPSVINIVPISVTTTMPVGASTVVRKVEKDYDAGFTFTDVFGNLTHGVYGKVIAERESDYGSGAPGVLLRTTSTQYLAFSNSNYLSNNLLDIPSQTAIFAGAASSGACGSNGAIACTTYGYDEYTLGNPGITEQHDSSPPGGSSRGNQTSVHRWVNTTNTNLISSKYYNNTGTVYKAVDPAGNATNYTYDPASPNYGAYLTKSTNALNQSTNYAYDANTGLLSILTDANNQSTRFQYDDMFRTTEVDHPDGGQVNLTYNEGSFPFSVTKSEKISSSPLLYKTDQTTVDGLGRVTRTDLTSDPVDTDTVDITYDADGRKGTQSNPHRSTSSPTDGITTYAYDALGRVKQVTNPDNTHLTKTYTGRAVYVQDESGVQKALQTDGLGRLQYVCDGINAVQQANNATISSCGLDVSASGFLATYGYDVLGNLTAVNFSGQTRSFVYDSLSRMTSETNPESGLVSYVYDTSSAGDMATRTAPKPNVSSGTVTTTYDWDALHRLVSETFSDGSLPVIYTYDRSSNWGLTLANTKGRLVEQEQGSGPTAIAGTTYSYDAMGRTADTWSCQPDNCGATPGRLGYNYNFIGEIASRDVVGGHYVLSYAYNAAGQLTGITSSLSDTTHPGTLYSNAIYNALGELTQGTYGDGIVRTNIYDNRGRLTNRRDAPTYYALYLGYTGNGSVNYYNDSTAGDWNFTYDAFNRLATSSNLSNGNAFTYSYDQYGNRWKQVATAGGGPQPQYSFNSHNQIVGFTYDAAGNLTSDGSCNPCWTYDDRGNLIQGEGATFAYDGLGRRVQKISGGVTYDFFLNLDGTPWDEYQGTVHSRVNGGLFTYANNTTYFNRTDHLGTPRVTTDYTATIVRTESNLPFGDGFTETTSPFLDFVGYAGGFWDAESNADHFGAREYGKTQGRWLSPDRGPDGVMPSALPYADLNNPQSLNLYSYVQNNPLSKADLDGHCADHYKDGTCKVNVDPATGQAGAKAGKQLEGVLNKYDKAVNALNNKDKFNIKDSNGKIIGSMTGKEIKAVWNGTSFDVTNKSFNNGGAGGGTGGTWNGDSFKGTSELNPIAVTRYAAAASARNEAQDVGLNSLTFHELAHETHFGEALTNQYPVTPTISWPREQGTSSAGRRMSEAVGAPFDCSMTQGGCQ